MLYYPEDQLDRWLTDDVPLGDLTTRSLGIGRKHGRMTFMPRKDCRLSGLTPALRILQKLGLNAQSKQADGQDVVSGTVVLTAEGRANALHLGWKMAQNIMEWSCGVSTYTARMLADGRAVNPGLQLACTRKSIPGTKLLSNAAVLHGGGIMHRSGLSETILLFAWHRIFTDTPGAFAQHISTLRRAAPEKKIVVEVDNMLEVRDVLEAGPEALPDLLQLDKFPLAETAEVVKLVAQSGGRCMVSAAGGVNAENIAEYSATGVHLVVSSAPYYAKPLNIKVVMEKA